MREVAQDGRSRGGDPAACSSGGRLLDREPPHRRAAVALVRPQHDGGEGRLVHGVGEVLRLEADSRVARVRAPELPGDAVQAGAITSGQLTLDFILDERARELAGEGMRWTDLALRGETTFINRVSLNPDATGKVLAKHVLRPIPQSQLDAISDTDKAKYQNPGY